MSQELPIILYSGDAVTAEHLQSVIEPLGGYVYTPGSLLEALGMAITYCPDLVIVDAAADPALAEQIAFHLSTVDLSPITVTDDHQLIAALHTVFPLLAVSAFDLRETMHEPQR